ncbi:CaiB Predicted acyl-CoA transferases/carnitine dehydratase [Burkholderiales bacterium]|jgi:crotonobetainyl-CoA:carnitine CoA-transferase CaiB-like acyl-CoA transferase
MNENQPTQEEARASKALPLAGIRVVEFTHMVMGPTCGLVLGDLGAEVIKVEPIAGDNTRRLLGLGAGFFPNYNRNKKSIAIDLHTDAGKKIAHQLIATADIVSENFKAGTIERLGLGYADLAKQHPRLIYLSMKGFLPGPYEHRTALDEVVQMMGGLAYMTGPAGQPLRAGASVNDMMGGIFAALGAIAALRSRDITGKGQEVQSALFENNIFLVGQHMMQYAVTGKPASPMPSRISSWGIYDVFTVKNDEQIFLAVVTDTSWKIFCEIFGFQDLFADERITSNNLRVEAREWLIPELRARLKGYSAQTLADLFEQNGLPYAPISKPHELLNDPHLTETGGLARIRLPDPQEDRIEGLTPLLPLVMDGERLGVRLDPPRLGEHTSAILESLGYGVMDIAQLCRDGVVRIREAA